MPAPIAPAFFIQSTFMIFQGKIYIEKGMITRIRPGSGYVELIADGQKSTFSGYALPGFTDSHGHLTAFGKYLSGINFDNASSAEACVEIAQKRAPAGEWIIGRNWNQEKWIKKELPDKKILDNAFPDIPVCFSRVDGHAAWCNSRALEIAGIGRNAKDPAGGRIFKDGSGNPTGILIDTAMELLLEHIPRSSTKELKKNIRAACNKLLSLGITEVHDMDVPPHYLPIFDEMSQSGELAIRIQTYVKAQQDEWIGNKTELRKGDYFSIRGLKYYADGALGSHGAALLKRYRDQETNGLYLIEKESLIKKGRIGIENGFGLAVHAIGDAAVRLVLDAYEQLRNDFPGNNDILRIEHAQIVHADDIDRFVENEVIASVQPIHCIGDMSGMAQQRLDEETLGRSYPWKSLLDSGASLIAGSDFPIESPDPISGMDAFINRMPPGYEKSWTAHECLDALEALNTYCSWPHKAIGTRKRGIIEKNMQADIVIVDKNPLEIKSDEIKKMKILAVISNGKIRYEKS